MGCAGWSRPIFCLVVMAAKKHFLCSHWMQFEHASVQREQNVILILINVNVKLVNVFCCVCVVKLF